MSTQRATLILWRDIPTQIVAGKGRKAIKRPLAQRFMVAVDKAAMKSGADSADDYLEDWRREDIEIEAGAEGVEAFAQKLEEAWPGDRLATYVESGGRTP